MNRSSADGLKKQRKGVAKKMYMLIVLLLVSCVLVTATTYAWLVITTAPEVTQINTVVGSNGNLEIALNTNDLLETELNGVESMPAGLNTFYERNVYWGNLVDLTDQRYGIQNIELKPAMLNYADEEKGILDLNAPIQFAGYDASGRVIGMDTSNGLASYDFNTERFTGVWDYGIRAAGENYQGDGLQASVPENSVKNTYAFCVDLLLRTNAEDANLLLQTKAIDRNNHDDGIPDEWYDDPAEDIKRGFGSNITISNAKMRSAIRVAFTDTLTGEVYAIASADSKGDLHIIGDTYLGKIKPLVRNEVTALTVWIYLDGNLVENINASSLKTRDLEINLQFRTDVELKPSQGTTDNTYDKDASDETGNTPSYTPVPGEYYFEASDGEYTYYVLDAAGERVYEATFEGTVKETARTITIESVGAAGSVLKIPAIMLSPQTGRQYTVSLNAEDPIRNAPAELIFVADDGVKVVLIGNKTGNLLGAEDARDNYSKIDFSGLDTSEVTDMSDTFKKCGKLEEINLAGVNTAKVTDMYAMFRGCSWLEEIDISSFETSLVTEMGHMFADCRVLKKLTVGPGWDKSNANVWYMYYDTKLETLP